MPELIALEGQAVERITDDGKYWIMGIKDYDDVVVFVNDLLREMKGSLVRVTIEKIRYFPKTAKL